MLFLEFIEALHASPDEAREYWHRCLDGLEDPARYFGPDADLDLHPGEQYYRLVLDRQIVGLGWVRRFTKAGHIRSFGFALYPEARNRRLSIPANAALITTIFEDYPETSTLLVMIYGTNPLKRWSWSRAARGRSRYVGEIYDATASGASLHISQITRAAWQGAERPEPDPYPENEWHGAPHGHLTT